MSLGFDFHYDSFFYNGKKYKIINNVTPMDYYYNLNPGSMPMNDNGHYDTARWGRGSVIYSSVFNKLILKDVLINIHPLDSSKGKSIKNLYMKGKIIKKINWYSGLLIGSYYDYKYSRLT